jgi:hypothetical protein
MFNSLLISFINLALLCKDSPYSVFRIPSKFEFAVEIVANPVLAIFQFHNLNI